MQYAIVGGLLDYASAVDRCELNRATLGSVLTRDENRFVAGDKINPV